jgi:single-stranded DNA-binding protein
MQVTGNIGSVIRAIPKKDQSGVFYGFSLAETTGRDQHKKTTWYEVTAFISPEVAGQLGKGVRITVAGTVRAEAFMRNDNTPGARLALTTGFVKVEPRKERDEQAAQATSQPAPEARDPAEEREYDTADAW